jgi:hypothetical protein
MRPPRRALRHAGCRAGGAHRARHVRLRHRVCAAA